MAHRVCPPFLGYLLASPVRRWLTGDPAKILQRYVLAGMTVLEPGPGMGFFTLPLARLVGPAGRVIAVDIQAKMLDSLKRRAAKAALAERVETRLAKPESMGLGDIAGTVDFVLAFAMVHETPSAGVFFKEASQSMKTGATLLLAEPRGHVKPEAFEAELTLAAQAGLTVAERPAVRASHAALLRKG